IKSSLKIRTSRSLNWLLLTTLRSFNSHASSWVKASKKDRMTSLLKLWLPLKVDNRHKIRKQEIVCGFFYCAEDRLDEADVNDMIGKFYVKMN
ncbi:MAG: hypothetical protein IIX11_07990, partial [Selenomonadales bacterium]|nr:hypothetical protein [Selenomonadales bacterium]